MKKLNSNDRQELSCQFDSNQLYVRLCNTNLINEIDINAIQDKQLAKKLDKLKKLINQSIEIAGEINYAYYNSF